MITWIDQELAIAIHERQLAEHGGGEGVGSKELLESALARPMQLFSYGDPPPDICTLAASLASEIAGNHPFVDGNKRTAHVCYRVFLELNGVELKAALAQKYAWIYGLADGTVSEEEFADWLRSVTSLKDSSLMQDSKAEYAA